MSQTLTSQTENPVTQSSAAQKRSERSAEMNAIRPFHVNVPEAELAELRRRISATRWPDRETVTDANARRATRDDTSTRPLLGVRLRLAQGARRKLNALPKFITEIDGLDIHFIHVRSKHENALPLIVTHGWPGSIIEQLKIIEPLTDPTAHGGKAEDAFDVVIPSMPGYGFSGKPTSTGWDPDPHRTCLDNVDEASRIQKVRGTGRRLGRGGRRS